MINYLVYIICLTTSHCILKFLHLVFISLTYNGPIVINLVHDSELNYSTLHSQFYVI